MNSHIFQLTGVHLGGIGLALCIFYFILIWYSLFLGFMSRMDDGNYYQKKVVETVFLAVITTGLVIAINWYLPPEIVECGFAKLCTIDTLISMLITSLQDLSSISIMAVVVVYLFWPRFFPCHDWTKLRSWQNHKTEK